LAVDTTTLIILAAVVLIAVAAAFYFAQARRSARLRDEFGPEYQRAVQEHGDRGKAEAELAAREARVEKLDIRPLSDAERTRFSDEWRRVQAMFVDEPGTATRHADHLVAEVMAARGYPVGDFDERADDVSVHHPEVVQNYRAAHALALLDERGGATTEDQRKALVHYRALFEELLEERTPREMKRGQAA
jgi:hypothetical protein